MSEEKEVNFLDLIAGDEKLTLKEIIEIKLERIKGFFKEVKWFLQKVVRPYHASDCDLWGLYGHLSPIILNKLKAFRKINTSGYPMHFSEYDKNVHHSKEEFDEKVKAGDIDPGGYDAWVKTIDEMIYAFEYVTMYEGGSSKETKKFLEKYNYSDPHEKIEKNKKVSYSYKGIDEAGREYFMVSDDPPEEMKKEKEKYTYLGKETFFFDSKLESEIAERAHNGLMLFGKFFLNLWD